MIEIISYNEKYKEQTLDLILSVLENEFGYKNIERPDLAKISDFYQKDLKSNFWLAILDDKVIGTIALQNYGNDRGFLKRMYVKKDFRTMGIGQKLFNTLLKFAQDVGHKVIYTSTVEEFSAARNFYNKNAFVEIQKLPKDIKITDDNVFLERQL